jgi:ribonucleoside-diphosphate reductase alpha chain
VPPVQLTKNAQRVLEARYLKRGDEREIVESADELFQRVAKAVSEAELAFGSSRDAGTWESRYLELLTSLEFLPNSPTLMNAGTTLGQLSACFVLPIEDEMESIFEAVKRMALVQRTGGGTGFSFSHLRPKGDVVRSTGGEASGPVSFMRIFDSATENIKQGGRRRGANLGVLRVDHPDILGFVRAKLEEGRLRNFNISVGVTDAFFESVRNDDDYALVHPTTGRTVSRLRAREVFDAIIDAAWQCGDPGLLFLDAIDRANPLPRLGRIEAANPCGEVPLLPYESCNLGSIHLVRMLREDAGTYELDWTKLSDTVKTAVRFLDDVLEVNRYPYPEIERLTRANRKIGLGVMGFAELLIRMGISYDSPEAVAIADKLMGFIAESALRASEELAEARGVFPNWKLSTYASNGVEVRNATRLAIAPTGTIGIIAGTSPSIEPLFALSYRRKHVLGNEVLVEVNAIARECIARVSGDVDRIMKEVLAQGSLARITNVPDSLKRLLVTALDVPPDRHLEIQAALQRHVDNSVSKTINLPETASQEEVARIYRKAWELGLKGITIYRYGSKGSQVIELGAEESAEQYDAGSRCDPFECRV